MRIECKDNLEMMQKLQSESIDLIYGDILYGTGKRFKDYQDLKADRKIIEAFYLPRIKEMHRTLKNDGSIYLQMDARIVHWVRCMMDDIFGYDKFVNEIIWCYTTGLPTKSHWNKKHDNILVYKKGIKFKFNVDKVREIHRGKEKLKYKKNSNGTLTIRKHEKGRSPLDWWDIPLLTNTAKERNGYFSQKPKILIERIIKASSNEGDLVADFFLGSGTTAVVCKELNREFIGCDINKRAVEITEKRLSAVYISPLLNFT